MTNRVHHSEVGSEEIRLDLTAFEFLINEYFDIEKEEGKVQKYFIEQTTEKAVQGVLRGAASRLHLINIKEDHRRLITFSRHSKNLGTSQLDRPGPMK